MLTSLYLVFLAKRDEKRNASRQLQEEFMTLPENEQKLYAKKANMLFGLFAAVLLVVILLVVSLIHLPKKAK